MLKFIGLSGFLTGMEWEKHRLSESDFFFFCSFLFSPFFPFTCGTHSHTHTCIHNVTGVTYSSIEMCVVFMG